MTPKILVRFDDICPTMDFTQWKRAVSILEKYDIKPLLGVIPDCKDPDLFIEKEHDDFWKYVLEKQKQGYSIAMHGYQHLFDIDTRGLINIGNKSEFAGHSYDEQYKKIYTGKKLLEDHGIYTDIFFAPAHSYDINTLKALSANGFRFISDGMSRKSYINNGVICLPCRSGGVPVIKHQNYYTAVFHAHEWVRPEKAYGYFQLENLCKNYFENIVNFDTYKQQPLGNDFVQRLNEKAYVIWRRNLKPCLSKIKNRSYMGNNL